jgi:hypothetical protein
VEETAAKGRECDVGFEVQEWRPGRERGLVVCLGEVKGDLGNWDSAMEGDEEVEGDGLVKMEGGMEDEGGPANAGREVKPFFWIYLLFRAVGSRQAEVESLERT